MVKQSAASRETDREQDGQTAESVAEPADEKLVDEAVAHIAKTLTDTLYKGVTEVGTYVLKTFFGDDPERVRSKDPNKNASFRMLAERCGSAELPISRSWLHSAVGVVVMGRMLPEGATAFLQLPPSHQTTLLPLRDPNKVEKIAQRAVNNKLTVLDLREVVADEKAKTVKDGEPRGRPPKPIVLKALDGAAKKLTFDAGRRSFTKAMVEQLDDDEARDARKVAEDLIDRLKGLVEKLAARS